MQQDEERLINIEMALAEQERMVEDLNQVIIAQGKRIDQLIKQNQYLLNLVERDVVKPQDQETPPPHY